MGKLDSMITFTGSFGNLSIYKTQDGYVVRRKFGPSARRIKTDPAYARTRENNAEFARAGKATRLMRSAFAPLLATMSDNRVSGRLTREILKVIKSDARNGRGERMVMDGDISLLENFDFNARRRLSESFRMQFTPSIDSKGGSASIDVPEFIPSHNIAGPAGATHLRLKSSAAVIDFTQNTWHVTTSDSDALPLESALLPALHLEHHLESTGSVFLLLGIEFLQAVNGTFYPMNSAQHNGMAIVKVGWRRAEIRKTLGRDSDLVRSTSDLVLRDFKFERPGHPILADDLKEGHYRPNENLNAVPLVSGPP